MDCLVTDPRHLPQVLPGANRQYLNDPSAHLGLQGPIRLAGIIVAISGIITMSILMGFVVDLVSVCMEDLRKGKSTPVEKGHTLILGWSEKMFSTLTVDAYFAVHLY